MKELDMIQLIQAFEAFDDINELVNELMLILYPAMFTRTNDEKDTYLVYFPDLQ